MDIISCDDDIAEQIDMKIKTKKMLDSIENVLSEREKNIIIMRYGLYCIKPQTQREVAKKLGISRSYVSRIEKSALEKLRKCF